VRRLVNATVRRVDQREVNQIKSKKGRSKKILRETIRKKLEINELLSM